MVISRAEDVILQTANYFYLSGRARAALMAWALVGFRTEREQLGKQAAWSEYCQLKFKLCVRQA